MGWDHNFSHIVGNFAVEEHQEPAVIRSPTGVQLDQQTVSFFIANVVVVDPDRLARLQAVRRDFCNSKVGIDSEGMP